MNGSSERGNIVLITSSLTSLMQSTDIQISAHPLRGLGWIPNKKQYHKKPQGSFGNLASDYKFAVTQDPKTVSKSARNVFEVKWITSEYYNVKFLTKGIKSFIGFITQEFPPCATAVNSLTTGITTL